MLRDLERLDGMHVGLLDNEELWLFEKAVADGMAYRSYEGGSGFMSLAKVRFHREIRFPTTER